MPTTSIKQKEDNCQVGGSHGVTLPIKFVPSLNLAALNQHKDRELYFWYLIRWLNQAIDGGSGWLPIDSAYYALVKGFRLYTHRSFYDHLSLGEGTFWQTRVYGSSKIKIYALSAVCEYMGTYPERFVELDQSRLVTSKQAQLRRALLWNTGAFKAQGKAVNPISRESLKEKTGIERRQQQRYDAAIQTDRQDTLVKYWDLRTFRYRVKKIPIQTAIGILKLPKQRGNLYHSQAMPGCKGMTKKVSKTMRNRQVSLLGGEALTKFSIVKCYFKSFSDHLRRYLRGKAPALGYYPLKSRPWVFVECLIR